MVLQSTPEHSSSMRWPSSRQSRDTAIPRPSTLRATAAVRQLALQSPALMMALALKSHPEASQRLTAIRRGDSGWERIAFTLSMHLSFFFFFFKVFFLFIYYLAASDPSCSLRCLSLWLTGSRVATIPPLHVCSVVSDSLRPYGL